LRVNARDVWAFGQIAVEASQGKVFRDGLPVVLLQYMIDLKSFRVVRLRYAAVFAPVLRPRSDRLLKRLVHA
jgi:hypothetical protein